LTSPNPNIAQCPSGPTQLTKTRQATAKRGLYSYSEGVNSVTTSIRQRIRIVAYIAAAVTALLATVWPAMAAAGPLSAEQQNRALSLASEIAWPVGDLESSEDSETSANEIGVLHSLGIQTISIEEDVIKNNDSHQQVRVYQYSYPNFSARLLLVSLANNKVVKQSLIESVHLPLTQDEHEFALTVLSADTDAITLLKADQQRRGHTPFTNINELSVKASIYKPLNKHHSCTHNRCALLSLFDTTNTVFAAEPIVNLQHGAVIWLER